MEGSHNLAKLPLFTIKFSLSQVCARNYVPQAYNVLGKDVLELSTLIPISVVLQQTNNTGAMYQHGQGVEENMEEAIANYNKGAELGK